MKIKEIDDQMKQIIENIKNIPLREFIEDESGDLIITLHKLKNSLEEVIYCFTSPKKVVPLFNQKFYHQMTLKKMRDIRELIIRLFVLKNNKPMYGKEISELISRPHNKITSILKEMNNTGILTPVPNTENKIANYYQLRNFDKYKEEYKNNGNEVN